MWKLGTWLSGVPGSAGLMVGISVLKDLFQAKWFYDSNMVSYCMCSNVTVTCMGSINILLRRIAPSLFLGLSNYIYCWLPQTASLTLKGRVHNKSRLIKHQISIVFNLAWTSGCYQGQPSQDFKANRSTSQWNWEKNPSNAAKPPAMLGGGLC